MTLVEETCAEFERLEKMLSGFTRPDPRTWNVFDVCAEELALSSVKLQPYLTPAQIAQLDHAYWHFMGDTIEPLIGKDRPEDGKINGTYLEDICQKFMSFGHDVIRHPEKYPVD
ncbi:MAG: hypothetical protein U1F83_14860 [Verrucomicrobiota bacterium]